MSLVIGIGVGLWIVASVVALALPKRSRERFMPGSALGAWLGFSSFDAAILLLKWSDYRHYGWNASHYIAAIALALFAFGIYGFAGTLLSYKVEEDAPAESARQMDVQQDAGPDGWDITWTGIQPAPEFALH